MNGAAERRFDPANDTHYAISEDDEMRLNQVVLALKFIGMMSDAVDPDRFDPREDGYAAIFYMASFAIEGALRDRAVVFPRRRP